MGRLILLAEYDEPGQLAGPIVQEGFRTEIVDTADAALRFCGITPVSLVITRVVFRYGISGVELVDRLKALASPPRVVMITSYHTERLLKVAGFPPPGVPLLRKPLIAAELLKHVRALPVS